MFRALRLRRGLDNGKYKGTSLVVRVIQDCVEQEKQMSIYAMIFIIGVPVNLALSLTNPSLGHGFLNVVAGTVFVLSFIYGWLGFWSAYLHPSESSAKGWECLVRLSQLAMHEPVEFFLSTIYEEQVKWVRAGLSARANRVVQIETDHPGEEDHPERVIAKREFEQAFNDAQNLGFIERMTSRAVFFLK